MNRPIPAMTPGTIRAPIALHHMAADRNTAPHHFSLPTRRGVYGADVEDNMAQPITRASSKRKWAVAAGATAAVALVATASACGAYFGKKNTIKNKDLTFPVEAWPNVGFNNALINGQKVVALTFDDGPSPGNASNNATEHVLDVLDQYKVPATFFVCNKLWADVANSGVAQNTLKRIVGSNYGIGSHTLDHKDLSKLNQSAINEEFHANEVVLRQVFGKDYRSTLVRAPYGRPYQTNSANVTVTAPIQMPFGVHVGWGIDTDDWKCAENGKGSDCILNNLEAQLKQGASGPILMHAVYELSAKTLPAVIEMLGQYDRKIVDVEDLVGAKYQHNSKDIMASWKKSGFQADAISQNATAACAANVVVVPEF